MQKRHTDREAYFNELAKTCRRHFLPYISRFKTIGKGSRVLEIGCGDGGNLLPFAQAGCRTLGVDIAAGRIEDARKFFRNNNAEGDFIAEDVFKLHGLKHCFDLIICHDVIEHIGDKRCFMSLLPGLLATGGIVFMSFPAWQMPFGGHQQICRSRVVSHLPYIHLLPRCIYRTILRLAGESRFCIGELMSIRDTRTPVELFERTVSETAAFRILNRTLWLVNPHYEIKFNLRPRLLPRFLCNLPYIRNFFTTSCFYILKAENKSEPTANKS